MSINSIPKRATVALLDPITAEAEKLETALAVLVGSVKAIQATQRAYDDVTRSALCSLGQCSGVRLRQPLDVPRFVLARVAQVLGISVGDIEAATIALRPGDTLVSIAKRDQSIAKLAIDASASTFEHPYRDPPPRAA